MRRFHPTRERSWWKIALIILFALIVLSGITFVTVDLWTGTYGTSSGTVTDKWQSMEDDDGNRTYTVYFSYRYGTSSTTVSAWTYRGVDEGDRISVDYIVGGKSGVAYVVDVDF